MPETGEIKMKKKKYAVSAYLAYENQIKQILKELARRVDKEIINILKSCQKQEMK